MICQRIVRRLLSSSFAWKTGRRLLRRRTWRIEAGAGAGLKLQVRSNFDYILGSSEIPVQEALVKQLVPGSVFYDIGANTGFFSVIAASRVGPGGAVYSFEPVAENGEVIQRNAGLNRFDNLKLFPVAVGKTSGMAELLLSEWDGGATLASSSMKAVDLLGSRTVHVVALDQFIETEKLRPPNIIKIDVEGVELEVLESMTKTIAAAKPVLLYEVDDGERKVFERRWKEIDEYVGSFGYAINRLENSYPRLEWNVGHSLALPKDSTTTI